MKRVITIIILLICSVFLSSCNFISLGSDESSDYDPHYSFQSQDRYFNEITLKEILKYFDNRDIESLKNMFSVDIQSKYDLESQIENAFDLYEGISVSHGEFWDYGSVSDYLKDGKYIEKRVGAEISDIITDANKTYVISFEKYIVHDDNEDMLGLYQVVLRDEKEWILAIIGEGEKAE